MKDNREKVFKVLLIATLIFSIFTIYAYSAKFIYFFFIPSLSTINTSALFCFCLMIGQTEKYEENFLCLKNGGSGLLLLWL